MWWGGSGAFPKTDSDLTQKEPLQTTEWKTGLLGRFTWLTGGRPRLCMSFVGGDLAGKLPMTGSWEAGQCAWDLSRNLPTRVAAALTRSHLVSGGSGA